MKYHCYEVGTEYYICTLYTLTDVLNLQLFVREKGSDIFYKSLKMGKKETRKVFSSKDTKEYANFQPMM